MADEEIAKVVADLRDGRWYVTPEVEDREHRLDGQHVLDVHLSELAAVAAAHAAHTVVDATLIATELAARPTGVHLYADHPCIAPPWKASSVCYVNSHGNVVVMSGTAMERDSDRDRWSAQPEWQTGNPVEWRDVRWAMTTLLFCGGQSHGRSVPTVGPLFAMQFAIAADGRPLDLHWVDLKRLTTADDHPEGRLVEQTEWDMALLTLLGTLNYMNCRNVELVDAVMPGQRAARRRIERTGVVLKTLQVRPMGRSTRSDRGPGDGLEPLHPVRGHFAHYGDCCPGQHGPRGLLFGRLTGRYYVPQHARGKAEHGEHHLDYRMEPSA